MGSMRMGGRRAFNELMTKTAEATGRWVQRNPAQDRLGHDVDERQEREDADGEHDGGTELQAGNVDDAMLKALRPTMK